MQIKEDVPVTSTDNGGNGLNDPKLPINKNIFKRFMNLKKNKTLDLPKSKLIK